MSRGNIIENITADIGKGNKSILPRPYLELLTISYRGITRNYPVCAYRHNRGYGKNSLMFDI